jgi:hypothetical protein
MLNIDTLLLVGNQTTPNSKQPKPGGMATRFSVAFSLFVLCPASEARTLAAAVNTFWELGKIARIINPNNSKRISFLGQTKNYKCKVEDNNNGN